MLTIAIESGPRSTVLIDVGSVHHFFFFFFIFVFIFFAFI